MQLNYSTIYWRCMDNFISHDHCPTVFSHSFCNPRLNHHFSPSALCLRHQKFHINNNTFIYLLIYFLYIRNKLIGAWNLQKGSFRTNGVAKEFSKKRGKRVSLKYVMHLYQSIAWKIIMIIRVFLIFKKAFVAFLSCYPQKKPKWKINLLIKRQHIKGCKAESD